MSDPRIAPYGSVHLDDVDTLAQIDPENPDINGGAFHLLRRHFDIQAFGVSAATGNAGDELIEPHHEVDDDANHANGHQELFAVMAGHAVFTVDGEEIDAPTGTIVFVRNPALIRAARATTEGTAIFIVGGRPGHPYTVSRCKHRSSNRATPAVSCTTDWGAARREPTRESGPSATCLGWRTGGV